MTAGSAFLSSGGSTEDIVRRSGLLPALRTFMDEGGAVYGGSAGAVVADGRLTAVGFEPVQLVGVAADCVGDMGDMGGVNGVGDVVGLRPGDSIALLPVTTRTWRTPRSHHTGRSRSGAG